MPETYTYVHVEGLDEFLRELNSSPTKIRRAESAYLRAAAQAVRTKAQLNAYAEGGVAAKSAEDIRIGGIGQVAYGGKPYNFGAEFGSYQYAQFERWRGKGDEAGYFLWPAIREFRDRDMAHLWLKQVWAAFADAFN